MCVNTRKKIKKIKNITIHKITRSNRDYPLIAGVVPRFGRPLHGVRAHPGERHVESLPAERTPLQLHNSQVIPGADLALLEAAADEEC